MAAIGDKVKVCSEVQRYTVQAADERFAILTKPYNLKRTYTYTIADRQRGERGACNLIFGPWHKLDDPGEASKALAALNTGELGVSRRNYVPLTDDELAQLWPAQEPHRE